MPDRAPRAFVRAPWALLKLAPPFSFSYVAIQQSGSSYPLSRLKRVSSGVVRMLSDSLRTSSMALSGRPAQTRGAPGQACALTKTNYFTVLCPLKIAYKSRVPSSLGSSRPEEDWSIQSKRWQDKFFKFKLSIISCLQTQLRNQSL